MLKTEGVKWVLINIYFNKVCKSANNYVLLGMLLLQKMDDCAYVLKKSLGPV